MLPEKTLKSRYQICQKIARFHGTAVLVKNSHFLVTKIATSGNTGKLVKLTAETWESKQMVSYFDVEGFASVRHSERAHALSLRARAIISLRCTRVLEVRSAPTLVQRIQVSTSFNTIHEFGTFPRNRHTFKWAEPLSFIFSFICVGRLRLPTIN